MGETKSTLIHNSFSKQKLGLKMIMGELLSRAVALKPGGCDPPAREQLPLRGGERGIYLVYDKDMDF